MKTCYLLTIPVALTRIQAILATHTLKRTIPYLKIEVRILCSSFLFFAFFDSFTEDPSVHRTHNPSQAKFNLPSAPRASHKLRQQVTNFFVIALRQNNHSFQQESIISTRDYLSLVTANVIPKETQKIGQIKR